MKWDGWNGDERVSGNGLPRLLLRINGDGLAVVPLADQLCCERAGGVGQGGGVDPTDWLDVAGTGREEGFGRVWPVGDGDGRFANGDAQGGSEFDHEGAGDASEAAVAERRGDQAVVFNDEDVGASAFAEVSLGIGKNGFIGAVIGVSIMPGATAFTRIPSSAQWRARFRVRASSAAFDEE